MNRFIIDGRYADMLAWHGLDIEAVLRKAQLPGDAFKHKTVTMSEENYFRFLESVGSLAEDPELPIRIATTNKIEAFSPPIFASYCSKNADICVERLARYRRLIGPMVMRITKTEENTTFQKQLNSTREMLAIHYIRNTDMNTNDIAFLLGYQEINSFLRAFSIWTGQSISDYKKSISSSEDT